MHMKKYFTLLLVISTLLSIDLSEYGWGIAQLTASNDGEHFFTANIFTGIAMKVRVNDGIVVGVIDTGLKKPKRSLAGIAEFYHA